MLSKYDYKEEEWTLLLKKNLRVGQIISIKIGLSPFNEWIIIEKDVELQGYSDKMLLCRPRVKRCNKNFDRYFSYEDITMIF